MNSAEPHSNGVRPVPEIANLSLLRDLLSDMGAAKSSDDLFRWVAWKGGSAQDYDQIHQFLTATGFYDPLNPGAIRAARLADQNDLGWLAQAYKKSFPGFAQDDWFPGFASGGRIESGCFYSGRVAQEMLADHSRQAWDYSEAEIQHNCELLEVIGQEFERRRDKLASRERLASATNKVLVVILIIAAIAFLGWLLPGQSYDCDYGRFGEMC